MSIPLAIFAADATGRTSIVVPATPGGSVALSVWYYAPLTRAVGADWSLSAPQGWGLVSRQLDAFAEPLIQTPTLADDLGAIAPDLQPLDEGAYRLALVTLAVPATASGLYTITPYALPGTGLVDDALNDRAWTRFEGINVAVGLPVAIPEPCYGCILATIVFAGLAMRRRRG